LVPIAIISHVSTPPAHHNNQIGLNGQIGCRPHVHHAAVVQSVDRALVSALKAYVRANRVKSSRALYHRVLNGLTGIHGSHVR
jgi:hypothetical protein